MSDSSNLPTKIPSTEFSFQINEKGIETSKTYTGEFTCRILTAKGKARANIKKAALNAGLENLLDADIRSFHLMVSWLDQALTKYPKWWEDAENGYNLYDANIVETVYN